CPPATNAGTRPARARCCPCATSTAGTSSTATGEDEHMIVNPAPTTEAGADDQAAAEQPANSATRVAESICSECGQPLPAKAQPATDAIPTGRITVDLTDVIGLRRVLVPDAELGDDYAGT